MTKELGLNTITSKNILDKSSKLLPEMSLEKTPPQNALAMYQMIAQTLKTKDIYHDIKQQSIQKAKILIPKAAALIKSSNNTFLTATKMAVAGNVIDLASQVEFDLENTVDNIEKMEFAIDDVVKLKTSLQSAKRLVYLADNAGENEFDKLYIKTIKKLFPKIEVFYFVRSKPIINDICFEDLDGDDLHEIATLIDSGNLTPGLVIKDLTPKAKEIFQSADTIISKGMGNYECLSQESVKELFFLLKIKCDVVANSLEKEVGSIICKKL